jgi:predicted RNase H-like HicB family nuclease
MRRPICNIFIPLFLPPIEDGSGYYAKIPDLPGCITTGSSLQDAIEQITDAASAWLVVAEDEGLEIAPPSPQSEIPAPSGGSLSLVSIDTIAYRSMTDTRAVRKNVSLPAWMASMADRRGINCSQGGDHMGLTNKQFQGFIRLSLLFV